MGYACRARLGCRSTRPPLAGRALRQAVRLPRAARPAFLRRATTGGRGFTLRASAAAPSLVQENKTGIEKGKIIN